MSKYTWQKFSSVGWDRLVNFGLSKAGLPNQHRWKVIKTIRILRHPWAFVRRKATVKSFLIENPPKITMPIEGYRKLQPADLPGLQEVVEHCQKLFEAKKEGFTHYYQENNTFKAKGFMVDAHGKKNSHYRLEEIKPILDFATSPMMVSIVANYLGEMPLLGSTFFMLTDVNNQTIDAQRYHLDKRGHNRIQFFIAIHDVDLDAGPFTFLPAPLSFQIAKKLEYHNGRIFDEEMYKHVSPDQEIKFTGSAGSTLMINASKCFHFGSRSRKKPRAMLELMYCSRYNAMGVGEAQLAKMIHPQDKQKISDPYGIIY